VGVDYTINLDIPVFQTLETEMRLRCLTFKTETFPETSQDCLETVSRLIFNIYDLVNLIIITPPWLKTLAGSRNALHILTNHTIWEEMFRGI